MITKKYDVVLACGGFGTRLKEITNDTPKPLFPIAGKSTLERSIKQLEDYNFKNVIITIGYKSKKFLKFIDELNQKYKVDIDIYIEENPLGYEDGTPEMEQWIRSLYYQTDHYQDSEVGRADREYQWNSGGDSEEEWSTRRLDLISIQIEQLEQILGQANINLDDTQIWELAKQSYLQGLNLAEIKDFLVTACKIGGTHRPSSNTPLKRKGYGRFGHGLPKSSISQTRSFSVYTKNEEDNNNLSIFGFKFHKRTKLNQSRYY